MGRVGLGWVELDYRPNKLELLNWSKKNLLNPTQFWLKLKKKKKKWYAQRPKRMILTYV